MTLLAPLAITLMTLALAPQTVYETVDKNDPDDELAFDWGGKDVEGNDTELEYAEFVFYNDPPASPPRPPLRLPTAGVVKVGTNAYLVRLLLATVTPGTYKVHVRAKGKNGLFGDEGNALFLEVVSKKPDVLRRLRRVVKP